jgi:hypothetical protein
MTTINNSYGRIETAEMIASAAIVFVRQARAEGYANKLTAQTIDGMAQELGIDPKRWTWSTVIRIVKANAKLMGETELLDLDPVTPKLSPTQASAMEELAGKGILHAYNGVSRATIKRLQTLGLVTVEWSVNTWTNYRSHRTHHQCDWVARPAMRPEGA